MSFALFQLNPIEILFLLGLGGAVVVGVVLFIVFLTKANTGRASLSQGQDVERLRDDYQRACERITRLEEENRQL